MRGCTSSANVLTGRSQPGRYSHAVRLVGDFAGRWVAADLLGGVLLADAVQDGQHIGGCAHGGALRRDRADVDGGWPRFQGLVALRLGPLGFLVPFEAGRR